jgi:hypothetical protein
MSERTSTQGAGHACGRRCALCVSSGGGGVGACPDDGDGDDEDDEDEASVARQRAFLPMGPTIGTCARGAQGHVGCGV